METPQEIEVWFVIPALRRELSKVMVAKGLKQKKIAQILNIKESAVSQYLSNKRGGDLKFKSEESKKIKAAADRLIKDPTKIMHELQQLIHEMKLCGLTCQVHKDKNPRLIDCDVCM